MAFQNVLRQITVILYRLKRQYGLRATIYQPASPINDVETGDITLTYTTFAIRRAIVLPDKADRSFIYDLTFIAANNNFVGGALFDRKKRTIIVDAKDVPKTFEPTMNDHIEFDGKRYELESIDSLEQQKGFLFRVQEIDNSTPVGP